MKSVYLSAFAVAFLAPNAQAAPVSGPAAEVGSPTTEKVQYRRCWLEDGNQFCDWNSAPRADYGWFYDAPVYGWRPTPARPEDYPTGSERWWDEMAREDRAGSSGQ
jgi:hypothetical protein